MKQKLGRWFPVMMLALSCVFILGYSGYKAGYAYLQAERTADNEFTVGVEKVKVVEEFPDPDIPDDYGPDDGKKTVHKKVSVENVGTVPCYVKLYAEASSEYFDIVRYEGSNRTTDLNSAEPMWYDTEDGYYYYTAVLQPGETTKPLFTDVVITLKNEWDKDKWDDIDADNLHIFAFTESKAAEFYENVLEAFSAEK